MTLSISEVIERIHRIDANMAALETERATFFRILEREALRQEEEDKARLRHEENDWTAAYKGQAGRILSAIWQTPFKRLSITRICEAGWDDARVLQDTLSKAIKRIRKQLRKDHCRFYLKALKRKNSKEIWGYAIRKVRGQKGQM